MVGKDYMLRKPSGPSAPKLFFDTEVIPMATNAVGRLEILLDRAADRSGIRPSILLAGMAGLTSLILFRLWPSRRSASRRS